MSDRIVTTALPETAADMHEAYWVQERIKADTARLKELGKALGAALLAANDPDRLLCRRVDGPGTLTVGWCSQRLVIVAHPLSIVPLALANESEAA